LPNGIETIEEYAFNSNRFSEALLPSSITKIETGAFYSYTNVYLDEVIDSIQLPNPVIKEGYSFNCWINGNGDTVTAMTDLETSYTAAFSEATFYQVSGTVITEEPNGLLLFLSGDFNGVQTVDDSGNFLFPLNEGRTVKITPERKGYVFDPENISIDNIQTDRYNLYFTSIIQSYEVNFFAGENGSLSGDVYQNIEYKQTTSPVTAIPNDGYMFKVWVDKNENEVGVENPIVIDVRNQMEVTAIFEPLLSIESNVFVSVNCYPNPIVNTATIVASKNIQKVEIYDIFGNLVFSNEKTYGYKYCLDLEKYANGVYFIKVKGEGFEETMKVVVK
jgi:hypothetical protein